MSTLQDRLEWYIRHQVEVLDYRHRFLVDYNTEVIQRWSRSTRRQKLTLLDNARKWYTTQCENRERNQTTIHDWFDRYIRLRNGKLVGRGIDNATTPSRVFRESEEYEFDWEPAPQSSTVPPATMPGD